MTFYLINDHNIDVPDNMQVKLDPYGPGAYDCIVYKGVEITTFEQEVEPEIYTGPFYVCVNGDDMFAANLAEAQKFIDEQLGEIA